MPAWELATSAQLTRCALYDRFSPGLYSFVLKMVRDEKEAEDVLQEGFAHIWRRANTYDSARSSPYHTSSTRSPRATRWERSVPSCCIPRCCITRCDAMLRVLAILAKPSDPTYL